MEKNVTVLDETGAPRGTTWPKRAEGLVKSGRARRIDGATIAMIAQPQTGKEGNTMSEIKEFKENKEKDFNDAKNEKLRYVLDQVEKIADGNETLQKAIDSVLGLSGEDGSAAAKAAAIQGIVAAREETNRQLLRFYEHMADSLTGPNRRPAPPEREGAFRPAPGAPAPRSFGHGRPEFERFHDSGYRGPKGDRGYGAPKEPPYRPADRGKRLLSDDEREI